MKISLAMLFLFVCTQVLGQSGAESLTTYDQLSFLSSKEKEMFNNYKSLNYSDILHLTLVIDGEDSPELSVALLKKVESFIDQNQAVKQIKNPKKQINKLSLALKNQLFKVYTPITRVFDNLSSGEYNSLTYSIITASILEQLDIPFEVIGNNATIYIVTYPQTDKQILSSTIGESFIADVDNLEYQNRFIEALRDHKIIHDDEFLKSTKTELFKKYYIDFNTYDRYKLLSSYYLIQALLKTSFSEFDLAYELGKKGAFLIPTPDNKILRNSLGYDYLNNQNYKDLNAAYAFCEIYKYNPALISLEEISQVGYEIANTYLEESDELEHFSNLFDVLLANIGSDSAKKEIQQVYYFSLATRAESLGELDSLYYYAYKLYNISSKSLYEQNQLFTSWQILVQSKSIDEVEASFYDLLTDYPELISNPYFQQVDQNLILVKAKNAIDEHRYAQALDFLAYFEQKFSKKTGQLLPSEEYIVLTFGRLAIYYFSVNNNKKALEIIERGLAIYPNNYDLMRKKKMILN